MSQPLYPPAGPQSIGQVLDSGFRIFQMSLVSCLLYGALSMIAGQLPNIYFVASGRPLAAFGGGDPLWIVLYFIGALFTILMYAALMFRQRGIATGVRLGTSLELSQAVRRLPAYIAMVLLITFILLVIPGIIVGVAVGILRAAGGSQAYLLILLISVPAAIPVVYLMTPFAFASPSVVLDDHGPRQAVRHVLRLVRGSWWRTTAILTVAFVLVIVFYGVAMVIVGLVLPLAGATDIAAVTAATGVVYVVLGSIGMPFFTAVLLAAYGELKVRKEGVDLEQRVAGVAQS